MVSFLGLVVLTKLFLENNLAATAAATLRSAQVGLRNSKKYLLRPGRHHFAYISYFKDNPDRRARYATRAREMELCAS